MALIATRPQREPGYLKELEQSDLDWMESSFGKQIRNDIEDGLVKVKKTYRGGYFSLTEDTLMRCRRYLADAAEFDPYKHLRLIAEGTIPSDSTTAYDDSDSELPRYTRSRGKSTWPDAKRLQREHPEDISALGFPKKHLFNRNIAKWSLMRTVFRGAKDVRYAEQCRPALDPIMQMFVLNHREFRYARIINDLTEKAKCHLVVEMPEKELRKFFSMIMRLVVPRELFGTLGNVKQVQKSSIDYIFSPKREQVRVGYIVKMLNLDDIKWLKATGEQNTKIHLMRTFMKWFLRQYIKVIINSYFFQPIQRSGSQRILVPLQKWIQHRDNFISQLVETEVLEKVSDLTNVELSSDHSQDDVPQAFMKFHIKSGGLRPIYKAATTAKQKSAAQVLKQLLMQAWALKSEVFVQKQLSSFWESIVKVGRTNGKPMYFVTADLTDAYGSIIQDKLLTIVQDIIQDLPEELILRPIEVLNPTYNFRKFGLLRQFYDESLPLLLSSNKLFEWRHYSPSYKYYKSHMMERLTDYVKNQMVIIGREKYRLNRGVAQGLPASTILANIYYGTVEMEELQEFKQKGWLARYMDDFLYVTSDRQSAEKFLDLIRTGIPKYNCRFNPTKTHTNLLSSSETNFTFLGFNFNMTTFEVHPDYSFPITQFNSGWVLDNRRNQIKTFHDKLVNVQIAKLDKVVLSSNINSKKRVIKTMLAAAQRLGHKCRVLIMQLFNLDRLNKKTISSVTEELMNKLIAIYKHQCDEADPKGLFSLRRKMLKKYFGELRKHKKLNFQLFRKLQLTEEDCSKNCRKRKRSITDDEQNDRRSKIKLSDPHEL